jgi:hypothetical protein
MKNSKQTGKNKITRIIIIILFLIIALTIFLLAGFPSIVNGANNKNVSVAIDIHSFEEANYSQDLNHAIIPVVQLDIIRGIMVDRGQPISDINDRIATLTAILSSPIPTATPNPLEPTFSMTISGTNSEIPLPSPTTTIEILSSIIATLTTNSQTPTPTSTLLTSHTPTITATKLPSLTNTSTVIYATNTPTKLPTSTSTIRPTYTSTKQATNTATTNPSNTPTLHPTNTPTTQASITQTLQPSSTPTSQAGNTATLQPTQTLTLLPSSTPTLIPTITHTTPATYTPTTQPTNTPTIQPTLTPTLLSTCSLPLPGSTDNAPPPNGFINAIVPSHNEINVSMDLAYISVFYNQPMELGTLGHGVQRVSNYQLRNLTDPLNPIPMTITLVNYDPASYIANVYFEATPEHGWVPQSTFEFISKFTISNVCGDEQSVDVKINFSTGTYGMTSSKDSPNFYLNGQLTGNLKPMVFLRTTPY